jgi:Tol biopolymer transport system component
MKTYALLLALLLLAPIGARAVVGVEQPTLVSFAPAAGATGNGRSIEPQFAAGGRYVVFVSYASDLVPGIADAPGTSDVFRRDRLLETTELVSRVGAQSGNGRSYDPWVSADGTVVAFTSLATDLAPGADTNASNDVFVRDFAAGTLRRVSNNPAGQAGNGGSSVIGLSGDGRVVVFMSYASDLTGDLDTPGEDLYTVDRVTGQVKLVSVDLAGASAPVFQSEACVSRDGRYVVWVADQPGIVANDANGESDVFVRDMVAGTTRLVSATPTGSAGNEGSEISRRCISDDGRFVVFTSFASDLLPGPDVHIYQVYVRDLATNTTTLMSVDAAGTGRGDGASLDGQLSADGGVVVFRSYATNLVASGSGFPQLYVRDRAAQTPRLVTHNAAGAASNGPVNLFAISPRADAVAFSSRATDLVAGTDANNAMDVFLWSGGAITRVSRLASGDAPNGASDAPAIGSDGTVGFSTYGNNLGPIDTNGGEDVYAYRSALHADGFE